MTKNNNGEVEVFVFIVAIYQKSNNINENEKIRKLVRLRKEIRNKIWMKTQKELNIYFIF